MKIYRKKQILPNEGTRKRGGRSGAILGMVLVIVLAISVVGLGLVQLGNVNAVEMARTVNGDQSFWSAEAGLHQAGAILTGNPSVRKGFFPYPFAGMGFGYAGRILSADNINFEIVSTGIWQNSVSIVRRFIKIEDGWPAAFDYALFSGETMKLAKDTSVTGQGENGDIYAGEGYTSGSKIPLTNGCEIYDGVAAGYPLPTIVPDVPTLDTTYYDNLLLQAVTSPNGACPASLGGGTYFVNQTINITGSINGPGILVVNGSVTIASATAVIGDSITIIALGPLSISSTSTLGSNDMFYSATSIKIAKENTFSAGDSVLITPGTIDIQKTFQFAGLIFAGGGIVMDKATGTTATITGCVVTGGDLTIKKDFNVIYDAAQLPDTILPGITPEIVVTDGPWSEVFL